ncbi:MAG: hypothetical protein WAW80_00360 [Candidatus Saccharimonadales bacterium]
MSLTKDDLQQIRFLIREEAQDIMTPQFRVLNEKIDELSGISEAVENDVKEIYGMLKPLNSELNKKLTDHEIRIATLESA